MLFNELVLASHNTGKLKELQAMLGDAVRVRSIGEFSDIEPEETGLSFVENGRRLPFDPTNTHRRLLFL